MVFYVETMFFHTGFSQADGCCYYCTQACTADESDQVTKWEHIATPNNIILNLTRRSILESDLFFKA